MKLRANSCSVGSLPDEAAVAANRPDANICRENTFELNKLNLSVCGILPRIGTQLQFFLFLFFVPINKR